MKYEYKVVQIISSKTASERQSALNIQGESGWDLVNIVVEGTNIFVYMKRAIVQ